MKTSSKAKNMVRVVALGMAIAGAVQCASATPILDLNIETISGDSSHIHVFGSLDTGLGNVTSFDFINPASVIDIDPLTKIHITPDPGNPFPTVDFTLDGVHVHFVYDPFSPDPEFNFPHLVSATIPSSRYGYGVEVSQVPDSQHTLFLFGSSLIGILGICKIMPLMTHS